MGIRFYCPNGHKMNVKSYLAGKIGFCPECGARMQIPYEDTRPSSKALKEAAGQSATPPGEALAFDTPDAGSPTESPMVPGSLFTDVEQPAPQVPVFSLEPFASETPVGETSAVPTLSEAPADSIPAAPASTASFSPPPTVSGPNPLLADNTLVWYLHIPGGTQYGPVASDVVATWIRERRIAPDMLVWREDWPEWKEAKTVFPEVLQY